MGLYSNQPEIFALGMTNFGASFVIMMIYLFAILAGLTNYEKYFEFLEYGTDKRGEENTRHVLLNAFEEIHKSLFTYMKIKFIASFVTGLGYGLLAYFFWIEILPPNWLYSLCAQFYPHHRVYNGDHSSCTFGFIFH